MVDAITEFVVGKIGNYLIEEASMFMAVKEDLEELKTELTCIHGYLKDVEAREREDEVSKEWSKLVLDFAYDVEDVLDTYHLKLEERSQRRGLRRLTNKIGRKMDAYSVVDDIKILKRRILDITRKRETYGIGGLKEPQGGGSTSSLRVRQLRRARSVDQEEVVVGLEDDAKILLEKLLDYYEKNRFIISIFGMGGLGKTALARKLYNSGDVKERFKYRAWTYVSQEYKTGDILMRIIRSLGMTSGEDLEKIRKFAEEELEVYLHGLLEGKKYLVVVDDIWEREAWESLKRALPCNHRGSRVIITTRIKAVAEGVDGRFYAHKLRFLTFEESWELFKQRAFRNIQRKDEDLLKTGKEMVQKCRGLPLCIVVLAGLLSRKTPSEWNDVCNSLWRRLKDDSIHVAPIVFDLSFKELRHESKLCFLYLSIFPEDYEIDLEKLIRLLVAEGFIQGDEEMMMEDVARYYIEELIDRSLLEAVRRERGKVMSCRIHDLLRDVAIKKSKELNFVNVYNDHVAQHSSTTCRREVVHHQVKRYSSEKRKNKRMRSFLNFGLYNLVGPDFETTKLLRVLDVRRLEVPSKIIGDQIHLRYLGIDSYFLRGIAAIISKLRFLQTLEAAYNYSIEETIDLRKLTSLRHVIGKFVGELLIGDAANLQTLRSICSDSWNKLKPELLINLRDLEIYDNYKSKEGRVSVSWASLTKLRNLRVLRLMANNGIYLSLKSEEAVRSMDVISSSLVSVTLDAITFQEDPMPFLQKMPRLEDLIFKNCDYWGGKMNVSEQGFGRLRKLQLVMKSLDELQIEEEAMPNLIELVVQTVGTKLIIPNRLRAFSEIHYYLEL
uniref:Disease resistance protein RPP13 variant n=2 Tax=Arabidopsis thaliana TaxID=3702 RepID=Q6RX52_ARATH|nr:disease resistance protein RPP13 variant [Arabidopsis thaliana]AAS93949.1 disease resistance protein RPP13 variant [Arabidopsis thaliana]AAS93950.1 disease resistance protein RPP13 variant [Arabidopsis thaliana]AAS93951.1 disease resistance protein RPP13 variant [Arabidopsis thaliana]